MNIHAEKLKTESIRDTNRKNGAYDIYGWNNKPEDDYRYQAAVEIERLEAALADESKETTGLRQLLRDEQARWRELDTALAEKEKECQRLRDALQFIARYGGTVDEDSEVAVSCNGSWCAEQARTALGKEGV